MPTINPPDAKTCREFIEGHKDEIVSKVYDINPNSSWIDDLEIHEQLFLFTYCPSAKWALASSRKAPETVLDSLSKASEDFVREALARNTKTAPSTMAVLAMDSDENVRMAVAKNYKTPENAFNLLARDTFAVKTLLTSNPKIPTSTIELLVKDSDSDIRFALIRNKQKMKMPESIFELLATDRDRRVRKTVTIARYTPRHVLAILTKDPDDGVRDGAKKALGIIEDEDPKTGCFIATAVYGSDMTPEVVYLKRYRDTVLTRHLTTRCLVRIYYGISPSIANVIRGNPRAKKYIRLLLGTLVKMLGFRDDTAN